MIFFDSLDIKILSELAINAKKSYTDIGKELKVHPNVIAYRVNRMEKVGLIKGQILDLDLEKIGFNEQLFVGANFPNNAPRKKIIEKIMSIPQTYLVLSTLGSPEILIFLLGRDKSDIERTLFKLRCLNLDVQYSSPIVKQYSNGGLISLLKTLSFSNDLDKIEEKISIIN